MGCVKSKQTFPFPSTFDTERNESEDTFMPDDSSLPRIPSPGVPRVLEDVKEVPEPSPVVLEYADRLAQEIMQDALQQWANNNIKYYNIPYIESEGSDIVG